MGNNTSQQQPINITFAPIESTKQKPLTNKEEHGGNRNKETETEQSINQQTERTNKQKTDI